MRITRMLGVTAVLLCGSLIFGSPSAFADGPMDPPSGGDSSSSDGHDGHDVDPPEAEDPDPPEVQHVDPPDVEDFDPPQVKHVDPPPPPIHQPADPGDDFVKPAGAPIDDSTMNPWWVITDFQGRCALAHVPTFELGFLLKGPFTTFGGVRWRWACWVLPVAGPRRRRPRPPVPRPARARGPRLRRAPRPAARAVTTS
jgi:hypothetical protein